MSEIIDAGGTQIELMAVETYQNCSYCSSHEGSADSWLLSRNIKPTQYQMLLDRGWRRIGYFICKPIVDKGCCRQYAIRCDALNFIPSKSQRQVLKRMRKFLMTEGDDDLENWISKTKNRSSSSAKNEKSLDLDNDVGHLKSVSNQRSVETVPHPLESADVSKTETPKIVKKDVCPGLGPDPNKPKCLKSKLCRRNKKDGRFNDNPPNISDPYTSLRSSIPHLNPSEQFKRNFKVILVPARESDPYFKSTVNESFEVFKIFQTVVLKEAESEWSFSKWARCFIDCPVPHDLSGTGPGYGNFHQQYILDGKIIAVGVITLIPNALVTEYFYYHPDYRFLTLGIYSAINEICFMNELHQMDNRHRRYYLGAYTHSSPKMRYKLQFKPSEILCPHTYKWIPVQDCLSFLLSGRPRLNPTSEEVDPNQNEVLRSTFDWNTILVCYEWNIMTYQEYEMLRCSDEPVATKFKADKNEEVEMLKDYVALVGDVSATSIPLKVPPSLYPM